MPKKVKLTHEACRAKVCAICYGRSGSKATRKITAEQELGMRSYVFSEYNMSDERFPLGLCTSCLFSLLEHMKGESLQGRDACRELVLPDPTCYDVKLSKVTRLSSSQDCQCMICYLARMNGLEWRRFVEEGKKGSSELSSGIKYDRLCCDCFAPIYRGSHHTPNACKSRRQTLENLTLAVNNANTDLDLVSSSHIKSLSSEANSSTVSLRQSTGGRPVVVNIGRPCGDNQQKLSTQDAIIIQKEAGLSDNQIGKVFKNLRLKFGRKILEPGVREGLITSKAKFDKFFTADVVQFRDSDGSPMPRPVVFCSAIVDFVSELIELRKLNFGDFKLKVGIDKGRGHLKMVLSLYNPDEVVKVKEEGRVTMQMGIGSGDDYSLIGKKKIFILAIPV